MNVSTNPPNASRPLEGQVALVTGASRGIGRAIALELGRRGAIVVGTATSAAGAASISEGLAAAGVAGRGEALDVNDAARCEALVEALQKGDQIITAGGIHGKVTAIDDGVVVIEVATGVNIRINKGFISTVVKKKD